MIPYRKLQNELISRPLGIVTVVVAKREGEDQGAERVLLQCQNVGLRPIASFLCNAMIRRLFEAEPTLLSNH